MDFFRFQKDWFFLPFQSLNTYKFVIPRSIVICALCYVLFTALCQLKLTFLLISHQSCVCSNIAAPGNGPDLFSKLVYLFLVTKYALTCNASMIWEKEQEALGNLFPVEKDQQEERWPPFSWIVSCLSKMHRITVATLSHPKVKPTS